MSDILLARARSHLARMMLDTDRALVAELCDKLERAHDFVKLYEPQTCVECNGYIQPDTGLSWDEDGDEPLHDLCFQTRVDNEAADAAEAALDNAEHRREVELDDIPF